jgi:hypothetical protein
VRICIHKPIMSKMAYMVKQLHMIIVHPVFRFAVYQVLTTL